MLAPEAVQALDRLMAYYSALLHKLYAKVAAEGGRASSHKTAFCHEHGITARFFNGLANDLQGTMDGTRELLKARENDLKRSIAMGERRLEKLADDFEAVRLDRKRVTKNTYQKWQGLQGNLNYKLTRARQKLGIVQKRLAANVPGIGFGSRKLFKQQYHLEENGYASHNEWLADWRAARAHQCFFLGSGDESGGNQSCTLSVSAGEGPSTLTLRIRLPDALLRTGEDKYLVLQGLSFPYDEPALRQALARGQALSWRIHRDRKGYRLMVSFARPAAPVSTLGAQYGAIGVDFNADHLAVTETDPGGNLIGSRRIELPFEGKSTGQRAALLSDALEQVLAQALRAKKPIVIEDLDFEKKKKQMAQMSAAQARALSGLAYAAYQQLMASKCHRRGVQLLKVNPAHTSVMGRLKYAHPLGLSVHQAAAGVIARRGQGLVEKPPRARELTLHAHGATLRFPLPERKDGQSAGAAWQAIGMALRTSLRERWLATRKPAQAARRGAKGKASLAAHAAGGSERGYRVPATVKEARMALLRREQICT